MLEKLKPYAALLFALAALILIFTFSIGQASQAAYNDGLRHGKAIASQAAYDQGFEKGYASASYDSEVIA